MKTFKLQIITPKKIALSEEVRSVTAPSAAGEITILPSHVPLFTLLKEGVVKVKINVEEKYFSIGGGYIETDGKHVNLLVSRAYHQDEIDEASVNKAKESAEQLLKTEMNDEERKKAMSVYRRSVIDLKVAKLRRRKVPTNF